MTLGPLTRSALHALYASGSTATEVMEACLARIEALGDPGIFLHRMDPAKILRMAAALPPFDPARLPLWGLPFVVKDNIDVAGCPTSAACPAFTYTAAADAPVVARLIAAGAIPLGKANLDQFATGLVGVRTPGPAPLNAFDPQRVPGGSSSGSAVAVAQGLACFSLGTDTAGSGRIPAAFNNLVGLKPTLGALSPRGVVPACRTLDCISIFALTVEDAIAVFDAAVGYDLSEPYSRPVTQTPEEIEVVGIPGASELQFFGDLQAQEAWQASVETMRAAGIRLREIPFRHFLDTAQMLYSGPWVAERRAAVGALMDEQPDAIHPVTRAILSTADRYSAVDAFKAFYKLAGFRKQSDATFARVDALAVPTAPIFPTLADLEADPIGPNSRLGTYTNFVNLLDLAAIAAPGPFRSDLLPAGATFIGKAGSDRALARLAARFFDGIGGAAPARSPQPA